MQAIHFTQYGGPEVLRLVETDPPTPQRGEVLVTVRAASVNALDWHIMRGAPFLARLEYGLRAPKRPAMGSDFAGTVAAVGEGVTRYRPGDAVFGEVFHSGLGAFAEQVCVPESGLALKPEALSWQAAASVPIAGLTALSALRDHGQIRTGQQVVISGASGGVGTFAVQLARHFGAHVTAVSSARNHELVRGIGAQAVIDYQQADYTAQAGAYDLILDLVGDHPVGALQRALRPGGRAVIVGFTSLGGMLGHAIGGPLTSLGSGKHIGMMGTVQPREADLRTLADLLASGALTPVIDRCYPLHETADAVRYVETGRARGKVVIAVGS